MQWHHYVPAFGQPPIQIFSGMAKNNSFDWRYSVDNSSVGHLDLTITEVTARDAGRFACEEAGTTNAASAELTVIGEQSKLLFMH